jgi:hypothetical protein
MFFPNYKKLKPFVETLTPKNQILTFEEQLCKSNMDYIFHTYQSKLTV